MCFDNAPSFCFESLESRSLLSVTPGTLPTDPATSIPQTQPATVSGPTNPTRTPLPGTVFNATWDQNPNTGGFKDVLWAMPQDFSQRGTGQLDYSEEKVREIARWARDGGTNWRYRTIEPAKFVVIDVEHIGWSEDYITQIRNIVTWFKEEAPNVAVGLYGFVMGRPGISRWWYANLNEARLQQIRESFEYARPVIEKLDAIVVSSYLLSPSHLQSDFIFMKKVSWLLREHFPDMPVVAWTWGNYHTSFGNSNASPLGHAVAKRYLATASGNFDAVAVWGQWSGQNDRWNGYLSTLPDWKVHVTYRPASPASTASTGSATTPFSTYRISVRVEVLQNG